MRERSRLAVFVAVLCAACATARVDPAADQRTARSLIAAHTGRAEILDPDAPALSAAEIDAVLADGLGLDEALRLAMLNSRRLQAGFLGLGVARADFVQAGLLENPSLGISFLLPSGGGRPNLSADLLQSIVDLWELPARRDVAQAVLQQRIFELSRLAGLLVVDTKDAYFESVAARDLLASARLSAGLARQGLEAVRERVVGGVATVTEENLARSQALSAELSSQSAERESFRARRRLGALLSLESDLMEVELTDGLSESSAKELDREDLAARSRSTRLDLRAAERALVAAEARLVLESRRTVPDIEAGVSIERPERGSSVDLLVGPTASIELPIFDRNRAQVRRAQFSRDQLRAEYEALVAEVGQDVRAAVDRAASAVRTARFVEDELLPQLERGAELASTAYQLGDTTLLPMLESQRALIQARRNLIESRLESARARVDVERVAGASIALLTAPDQGGPSRPR